MYSANDLPFEGKEHNKALYIKVQFSDKVIPCVMVDNGSALNLYPLRLLPFFGITEDMLQKSNTVIRAYDDSKRGVIGTFEAEITVGGVTKPTKFTVLDIPVTYSLLLGRPWIHSVGAVPSSLHQKLKFVHEGKLISVNGDEDIISAIMSDVNEYQVSMLRKRKVGEISTIHAIWTVRIRFS